MQKFKIGLVIGLVYLAGIASGVVVTRAVVRHMVAAAVHNPARVKTLVEKRLSQRLKLDANQRVQMDQILTHTQSELGNLRQQFSPRFQAIMSDTQTELAAILTPEQRERFEKFREENRHFWQPD